MVSEVNWDMPKTSAGERLASIRQECSKCKERKENITNLSA